MGGLSGQSTHGRQRRLDQARSEVILTNVSG
jgi:hypothetical protein